MSVRKKLLGVLTAAAWIALSEFARNQFLLQDSWTGHYRSLGLDFPAAPVNGAVWGLWSLLLAIAIAVLATRFGLLGTTLLAWLTAFVMMWVVIGNLAVLPFAILWYAVPLSLVEVYVAALIVRRLR